MRKLTNYLCYIILNISEPHSTIIHNIREKYDPKTAELPVEITVLGSSGIGPILPNQSIEYIIKSIEDRLKKIKKFSFNFYKIDFFQGTNIFYLKPKQREYFDNIHKKLSTMDLKFQNNKFPYNPHCTLHTGYGGKLKIEDFNIIEKENFPKEKILIDKISLIEFNTEPLIFNYIKTWNLL